MAVKDQKFYWLKLKTEFMTGDVIDFLMSQKNGANYVVLYEMLCIKTINTEGELATRFGDILVPYDIDKIQRECKWFDRDTVIVAMELYKKLGLIYEQADGVIKIADFKSLVGSETYWAKQKRLSSGKEEQKESVGNALEFVQQPLISISSSNISTSNSTSNSDIEVISNKKKIFTPPTYEEVLEYAQSRNRADLAKKFFDYFTTGNWVDSNGKRVRNWKQKFITWEQHNAPTQQQPTKKTNNYDDILSSTFVGGDNGRF